MAETPELLGMGGILIALITAWSQMRPAMKKIESEEDNSLRTDLLARIKVLEDAERSDRAKHLDEVKSIRIECDLAIQKMTDRHERVCRDYEAKLHSQQDKIDLLMDALVGTKKEVEK